MYTVNSTTTIQHLFLSKKKAPKNTQIKTALAFESLKFYTWVMSCSIENSLMFKISVS